MVEKEHRLRDRRKPADRRKNSRTTQQTSYDTVESNSSSIQDQHNTDSEIRIGILVVNRSHKIVTVNNVHINLTHKEFEIIDYLAENPGHVVETEDIVQKVWDDCSRATKADVHQYVHMLRKKIEADPKNPKLLVTVKGFGYELRDENSTV